MKKITIMLICWASTLAVFAQDTQTTPASAGTNEIHTLFKKGNGSCKVPLGYFIEMNGGYTQFRHKSVFLPGMSMGVILNHHWTVGLTGSIIGNMNGVSYHHTSHDSTGSTKHRTTLNGGYGGLLVEYTLFPRSRVHVAFPLMIGGGYMYRSRQVYHSDSVFSYSSYHDWNHGIISSDHFFVVEPGVRVECNVVKSLRIGFGISYRYAPDFDLKHTSSDLLNQFTAKLILRFGKF